MPKGARFINTEEKILSTAIQLMGQKGFKAVTIKDIAEAAGFSEMTLFRHFETKIGILEAAIRRYSYVLPMQRLFIENVTWDLAQDLLMVAREYQTLMQKNRSIVLIALEERGSMPSLMDEIAKRPRELKKYLIEYFIKMQALGKVSIFNVEAAAVAFIHMNFGLFFSTLVHGDYMTDLKDDTFIEEIVKIFVGSMQR